MKNAIRIGTRESRLALWQAEEVKRLLEKTGSVCELVPINSEGDIDLVTPLYKMGVTGIFTKTLDAALLSGRIDIAVHSLKDVPTEAAEGLAQAAVLQRGPFQDVLVLNGNRDWKSGSTTIATGSIRRRAQWLNRYPSHSMENLRGNVQTRLQKLAASDWGGAIMAIAGLSRLGLNPVHEVLDWMLPAPAQGAVSVYCRANDEQMLSVTKTITDHQTAFCTAVERSFLRELEGGCSAPIGALAEINGNLCVFRGNVLSPDGKQKTEVKTEFSAGRMEPGEAEEQGITAARKIRTQGADAILKTIRHA